MAITTTYIAHKKTYVFLLVLVFGLYSQTMNLGFYSDDYLGINGYQTQGIQGFFNNLGVPFFMPINYLFQFAELKIFGVNYTTFKIINLLLFYLTALFVYHISRRINSQLNTFSPNSNSNFTGLLAATLFIASPYQTETINWFASQAYILSTLLALVSLNYYLMFKESTKPKHVIFYFLFFFLSILCKEISIILPIIIFAIALLFGRLTKESNKLFLIGNITTLGVYFLMRYIFLGNIIGGYGVETHLNFDLEILGFGIKAYMAKFFLLYRYSATLALTLGFVFLALAISIFVKPSSATRVKISAVAALLLIFIISLFPVLNLETSFLGSIQSDRYGYLPSVFFAILISSTFGFYSKRMCYIIALSAFSLYCTLTIYTNQIWVEASEIRDNLVLSIDNISRNDKNILLVNLPDNYRGVYIFRNGFSESLRLKNNSSLRIAFTHEILENAVYELKSNKNDSSTSLILNGKLTKKEKSNIQHYHSIDQMKTELIMKVSDLKRENTYYFNKKKLIKIN